MKNNTHLLFITSFFLILFDQVTKFLVKGFSFLGLSSQGFEYGERIEVIGDIIQFTFVENPGMAFSIEFGAGKIFLSLFSIIASLLLILYIRNIGEKPIGYKIAVMLIFAGATGNMIDRVFYGVFYDYAPLFYGKVVDFILVDIPNINIFGKYYDYFPVFNIADSCVSVGIVLLLFYNKHIPTLSELRGKNKDKVELNE
ncbi:MAG: signal peptidase II [Ignavibacteriae bacterium]|nr:signal peptidase II [Ignavibacteriota bacterium]MCB9220743.1 signal peptidase II [Ignavibacteria bacterium]